MKLMEHSLLTSNIDNKRNFPPFGLFTAGDKFGRRQGGAIQILQAGRSATFGGCSKTRDLGFI
jgi:hypothetical protein